MPISVPTKPIKHIGLLLPRFNAGGAERVMVDYANLLVKAGYQVTFFVGVAKGPYQQLLTNEVAVIELGQARILLAVLTLRKALKKHGVDVLIATLLNANLTAILATKLFGSGTAVVIREATTPSKAIQYGKRKVLYRMARQLFKKADSIIAVSQGVKTDLMQFYGLPDKLIKVIYNPNFISYSPEVPDHPFFQGDHKVILGVGRFVPVKNFPLLIQAFSKVQAQFPEARLLILGKKGLNLAEEERVQAKIDSLELETVIDILDFQPNIADYLSHAKLYVLSSDYEGLPNVLIQSLACGTAVVSTNCCTGVSEILDSGKFGKIVAVNNHDAMASAILAQLHSSAPSKQERFNRANFFAAEHTENKIVQLLNEI